MRLPVVLTEATKWLMLREIREIVNRGVREAYSFTT
jgi:hypothetical protein